MLKIKNKIIELTRGNGATFEFSIDGYSFVSGDKVEFKVYEKYRLDKAPLLIKTFVVNQAKDSIDIELSKTDTEIGEPTNNEVEYWYEINLNDEITVIGYDDNGPKKIILYPKGV